MAKSRWQHDYAAIVKDLFPDSVLSLDGIPLGQVEGWKVMDLGVPTRAPSTLQQNLRGSHLPVGARFYFCLKIQTNFEILSKSQISPC